MAVRTTSGRPPRRRARAARAVPATGAALALLLPLTACGSALGRSGERPPDFAERAVTWAQGRTIHYGDRTFTVPGDVELLWRTDYGLLARVRPSGRPAYGARLVLVDARGTTRIDGRPTSVKVSPDGRYAGWIDRDGPRRLQGRLAEAVVVDLRTGREVLRDHRDMGGATDDLDDLYEDAGLGFLGFDETHAYWRTAVGSPAVKKAGIGTWEVGPGGHGSEFGEVPDGQPYDALTGRETGMDDDGRPSRLGDGLLGFVSPEGRWCLTDGETAHLRVVDCRTARDVTPDYPSRWAFFGGWQDADTFYVLSPDFYDETGAGGPRDTRRGVIASCTLPEGRCRTLTPVRRADSVVFATGGPHAHL